VVRSIAVEDPWPTNLCWRMLLADGRVVVAPVTIQQLHEASRLPTASSLVELCARAVQQELRRGGPVPKPTHEPGPPDLAQTVVGFRAWSLRAAGELGPIGSGKADWRGAAEVRALCASRFHASPDPDCHCGWNAWHDPLHVKNDCERGRLIVGAIAARGRIEVHTDGFRSEWARPICLAYPDAEEAPQYVIDQVPRRKHAIVLAPEGPREKTVRDHVEAIARQHGLPAVPFGRLEAFAREHGSPVPPSLRPEPPNYYWSSASSSGTANVNVRYRRP
jgi:hypothetical protein